LPLAADRAWTNARLATLDPRQAGLGAVEPGAVACKAGRIVFAGPMADCPAAGETIDLEGRWLTPGLVDCHTHIVHGGNRAGEFELRLAGRTYREIAEAGGGILSTVRATRAASEADLITAALPRVDALLAEGVTTLEIKSGYGLDLKTELAMLRAARTIGRVRPVSIVATLLGAHAIPPDNSRESYLTLVCDVLIPQAAAEGLADAVDAFCEGIAFSAQETERVFLAGRRAGLPLRLHAEQLSHSGGTALAARYGALSADHLEHASKDDAALMGRSGTVAVLLPGAFHMLCETQKPPIAAFRRHAVPMAVSTDSNPGSSPLTSLLLAMNLACVLFGLTVEESVAGVTREAARALGRLDEIGTLEAGKRCDLAIWSVERLAELPYRMGFNPLHARVFAGCPDGQHQPRSPA